jgi:hypothetical protein
MWRAEVRSASVQELIREPELLRICIFAQRDLNEGEPPYEIPDDPEMTLALLQSGRSETRNQRMGSRAVRRSTPLGWDTLIDVYGDEDTLRARVEALKASGVSVDEGLLGLTDRDASGWRPDDFGA